MTATTTAAAPTVRALNEDLIGACLESLRAGQRVNRKALMEEYAVGHSTVQTARRIASERLRYEAGPEDDGDVVPLRRRSPFSPQIDGQKLARLRFLRAKMSQGDLAAAVAEHTPRGRCSRVWIAKLEANRGQPSVETFRALCEVLRCHVADLVTDDMAEWIKGQDASYGELFEETSEKAPDLIYAERAPRGGCSAGLHEAAIRKDGTLRSHYIQDGDQRSVCEGSRKAPGYRVAINAPEDS